MTFSFSVIDSLMNLKFCCNEIFILLIYYIFYIILYYIIFYYIIILYFMHYIIYIKSYNSYIKMHYLYKFPELVLKIYIFITAMSSLN